MNTQNPPLSDDKCNACPVQPICKQFKPELEQELPFDLHELERHHGQQYAGIAKIALTNRDCLIYIPVLEATEFSKIREAVQALHRNLESAFRSVIPEDDPRLEFVLMQLRGEAPWQQQTTDRNQPANPEPQPTEYQFCQREGNTLHIALWRFELDALTDAMTELHIHPSDDGKMGKGQILDVFNLARIWQTPRHPGWQQLMDALSQDNTAVFTVIFELQPLALQSDVEAMVAALVSGLRTEFDQALEQVINQTNEALRQRSRQFYELQGQITDLKTQYHNLQQELEHHTWRWRFNNWWENSRISPGFYFLLWKTLSRQHDAIRMRIKFAKEGRTIPFEQRIILAKALVGEDISNHEWYEIFPTPFTRFRAWRQAWTRLLDKPEAWTIITSFNAWRYVITHKGITMFDLVCSFVPYICEDGYATPTDEEEQLREKFLQWNTDHPPFWRWNIFTKEFWFEGGTFDFFYGNSWNMAAKPWNPDPWKTFGQWTSILYLGGFIMTIGLLLGFNVTIRLMAETYGWSRIVQVIAAAIEMLLYFAVNVKIYRFANWASKKLGKEMERRKEDQIE